MIRFLNRNEIDIRKWDACIDASKEGQAFYYSWYLDSCCEKWGALIEGNYESVFPFAIKNKLGIEYSYQAFFTRHYGLISKSETDAAKRLEFIAQIPSSFKFLDFCLHKHHQELPENAKREEKIYQELNLRTSYEEIRKGYHENLNRNLKKARKFQLKIHENFSPELLIESFKTHQEKAAEKFSDADFQKLLYLMKSASEKAIGICWAVQDQNKSILSAAFFMKTGNRWLYLKGFTSPEGKKCGASHFLFDQFISKKSSQDADLDFGGSSIKSVARFYQSFGSADCVYLRLRINRLPKALSWLKR